MPKQTLHVIADTFAIHSLDAGSSIPAEVMSCELFFIGKTPQRLKIHQPNGLIHE